MRSSLFCQALISLCILLFFGLPRAAGQGPSAKLEPAKLSGSGQVKRTVLKREQLLRGTDSLSPVDDSAGFALPAQAAEPTEFFEGTLTLKNVASVGHFTLLSDIFQLVPASDSPWKHLPPFRFQFVQSGSFLIPVVQGLSITGDPAWNYMVGPGRVWRETGDAGYMRASLPFALVQRNQNCVHNGAMTFLFNTTKRPRISRVFYQITQETCYPMKFDMWGVLDADFSPAAVAGSSEIRARFAAEQAHQMPTKPLSALAEDLPGTNIDVAAIRRGYKHPEDITTYGMVFRGIHYSAGCPTRFGEYAFCDQMRLPSYSIAKSVFAGVALMRLGQLYGTGVYDLRIKDYVPPKENEGHWETTTFGNTSDMATGNFNSEAYEADEDSPVNDKFLIDESLESKIRDAFAFDRKYAPPGTTWVYQSPATFLLTQAMNAYLRQKQGPSADVFTLVQTDVYEPLEMSQGFMSTIRTANSPQGAPTGYYGLFFNKDDAAKLSTFLNNASGKINGEQVLEPTRLAEALFRAPTTDTAGVPILGHKQDSALGWPVIGKNTQAVANSRRYAHGFWGRRITPEEFPEFQCDFWISLMAGYGGNIVLLAPNGATFYIFTDGMEFPWTQPLSLAAKLAPMCNPPRKENP
jgi:hypothetical protein